MSFKERFKEILENENLNAKQLSKKIGIDHTSLYDYLLGSYPNIDKAVKIANYFKISLNYLFGIDDYPDSYGYEEDYDCNKFFARYTNLLKNNNLSHHRLCKDTGVNPSSYWLWSKGSIPKCENLIKIAEYLNCTIDYLVGRSNEK